MNRVTLLGNVGKDPELKTVGGTPLAKFSVATNERYKDRDGNRQDHTEWHNVECWGKTAEFVAQYVKKGRMVYIEGSLRTSVSGEGAAKKYFTTVRAQIVQLVGPRPAEDSLGEEEL